QAVHPMDAEFGRPLWQLGSSTWAFADATRLVAACGQHGRWRLVVVDVSTGSFLPLATDIEPSDTIAATRTHAVLVGGSARAHDAVVRVDLATGETERIRSASATDTDAALLSLPATIEFPTEGSHTAHAFFYAPNNP